MSELLANAMNPVLARIDLYPVKSLDGIQVTTAQVLSSGALQHDRAFALFDSSGRVINGKRYASIHRVRSRFDADISHITLQADDAADSGSTFHLVQAKASLEDWFSNYFQQPLTLRQNPLVGFPDDTDSPGPTVISTATLQTVADWFGLSLDETRRRFRTNLEIDGVPAFWEDRLFSQTGEPVRFKIGSVTLQGINPCQRCIVPTRDTHTGEASPTAFQKQFAAQRAATLPNDVARSRFNHFYRLAVNTRCQPMEVGSVLQVGNSVKLL